LLGLFISDGTLHNLFVVVVAAAAADDDDNVGDDGDCISDMDVNLQTVANCVFASSSTS